MMTFIFFIIKFFVHFNCASFKILFASPNDIQYAQPFLHRQLSFPLCQMFWIAFMMHNGRDDNSLISLHFENNFVWEHCEVGFSESTFDLLKDERMRFNQIQN